MFAFMLFVDPLAMVFTKVTSEAVSERFGFDGCDGDMLNKSRQLAQDRVEDEAGRVTPKSSSSVGLSAKVEKKPRQRQADIYIHICDPGVQDHSELVCDDHAAREARLSHQPSAWPESTVLRQWHAVDAIARSLEQLPILSSAFHAEGSHPNQCRESSRSHPHRRHLTAQDHAL